MGFKNKEQICLTLACSTTHGLEAEYYLDGFLKHVYSSESLKVLLSCFTYKGSMVINSGYRFLAILEWKISVRYEISFLVVLNF